MELSKDSKTIVDKEFEIIYSIAGRISHNGHNPSDNFIKLLAIAIYLKNRKDLRTTEER